MFLFSHGMENLFIQLLRGGYAQTSHYCDTNRTKGEEGKTKLRGMIHSVDGGGTLLEKGLPSILAEGSTRLNARWATFAAREDYSLLFWYPAAS